MSEADPKSVHSDYKNTVCGLSNGLEYLCGISDMLYINKPIPTDAEADLGKEGERVMSVGK